MLRTWIPVVCAAAVMAAPRGTGSAGTTLARMNLEQLTEAATVVARAKCLGSESHWQNGEIWTVTRFATLETFKGLPPAEFAVRLIGGRVGTIESVVASVPRFRPGEEVILFLDTLREGAYSVTAWKEGTFRVRRRVTGQAFVTQETATQVLYDPATHEFRPAGVRRMPLAAFRRLMRQFSRKPLPATPHATSAPTREVQP